VTGRSARLPARGADLSWQARAGADSTRCAKARGAARGGDPVGITARRLIVICAILALAVAAVMFPRLRSAQFGLLDDGITIEVSRRLIESAHTADVGAALRFEAEEGRLRPVYWLYYAVQYAIFGESARGHFLANALVMLLTAISVAGTAAMATRSSLASLGAGLAYVFSPPVIESYYTLSKPEVPLALFLSASLCGWAGARAQWEAMRGRSRLLIAASALPLLLAYLTKETALAMVLVVGTWTAMGYSGLAARGPARADRWYLAINVACAVLIWAARDAAGIAAIAAGAYSKHYTVTAPGIVSSLFGHLAWFLRDFPALLPLAAFAGWARRRTPDGWIVYVPVLWILAWTAIMLPWHSVHEYYLLPAAIGVSLAMGAGLASLVGSWLAPRPPVRMATRVIAAATLVSTPFVLGNMVTSARVQLAIDAANASLVDFLAKAVPLSGIVLLNVPAPNEYAAELAAHLKLLKRRHDVAVGHTDQGQIDPEKEIFMVSPFVRNQSFPTVRLAVSEAGTTHALAQFYARYRGDARLVYRHAERPRLLATEIEKPLCPILARALRESLCRAPRVFDTRRFTYGWEVYRLGPI
jgi:hypothetical protein